VSGRRLEFLSSLRRPGGRGRCGRKPHLHTPNAMGEVVLPFLPFPRKTQRCGSCALGVVCGCADFSLHWLPIGSIGWKPEREVSYELKFPWRYVVRRVGMCAIRVTLHHHYKAGFGASRVFYGLNPFTLWFPFYKEKVMGFLSTAMKSQTSSTSDRLANDEPLKKKVPALAEFMTAGVDEEGKPRRGSSITVFCEGGYFKVVLRERDSGFDLWGTGPTLWEALHDVDKRLQEPVVEWRRPSNKGKGK